uniref:Uncharacterized protein n=1 Tax=Anguilla anguilla TaxID=7936 RepID=A0A0E9RY43_ANGAN
MDASGWFPPSEETFKHFHGCVYIKRQKNEDYSQLICTHTEHIGIHVG